MKCDVDFVTETQGERTASRACGELEYGERLCVSYSFEGDEVTLVYDGALTIVRRGAASFSVRFFEGEESVFLLGLPEKAGEIPVRTELLRMRKTSHSFLFRLHYKLIFGSEPVSYKVLILISLSEAL